MGTKERKGEEKLRSKERGIEELLKVGKKKEEEERGGCSVYGSGFE